MKADKIFLFENESVGKAILRLALPSVMGQIILVIYNMADTFFVGLSGSDVQITAVTMCMPAYMFLSAVSNLFGVGGASLISRSLGAERYDIARRASAFSVFGCVIVSLLYAAGCLAFLHPFADLLGGASAAVHEEAVRYLLIVIVIGGPFAAVNTLLSHLIRAEGRSLPASLGVAIGGLLNIALDPLFMFVIMKPGCEVVSVAAATLLSNCIASAYYVIYLIRHHRDMVFSVRPRKSMFSGNIPREVIRIGIPACLMTLCENISYALLNNRMALYGHAAQAGIGVAKKINMLAHSIVRGITHGVLPLIGYSFSSGNWQRMRKTVRVSSVMSITIACVLTGISLVFADGLIGLFIQTDGDSLRYGSTFLRILCVGAPFSAWAYTVISFFQAAGRMGSATALALLRKGVVDIPLMFLYRAFFAARGLVLATPAADLICCVTAAVLYAVFCRRTCPPSLL